MKLATSKLATTKLAKMSESIHTQQEVAPNDLIGHDDTGVKIESDTNQTENGPTRNWDDAESDEDLEDI